MTKRKHQQEILVMAPYQWGNDPPQSRIMNVGHDYNIMTSSNSPRVNGRLALRQNTITECLKARERHGYSVNNGVNIYSGTKFVEPSSTRYVLFPPEQDGSRPAALAFYLAVSDLSAQIGEALGQAHKTIDLIASTATRIADTIVDFRRRNFKRLVPDILGQRDPNLRKAAAADWLRVKYGWIPLMQDIEGSIKASVSRAWTHPVKVSRSFRNSFELSSIPGNAYQWQTTTTGIDEYRCTIKAQITVGKTDQIHRMGLDNPALTAWELVPYSFVVDWFLPVSSFLDGLMALRDVEISDPSTTVTRHISFDQKTTLNKNWGWYAGNRSSGHMGSGHRMTKTRSLSLPRVPPPRFKNPLSVTHAVNAIALITLAFSRKL